MLANFSVKNFKNFNKKITFELTQIKNYEFNSSCIKNDIVNNCIIYGPNGSGKSNLGFAIMDIVSHLTNNNTPAYTNYLYGGNSKNFAEFEYTFHFNNSILVYKYGKQSQEELLYEELLIDGDLVAKHDKRRNELATINLEGAENLNREIGKNKISIIKYIVSNTILEKNSTNEVFLMFNNFVHKMLFFRSVSENSYIGYMDYQSGSKKILQDILEHNNLHDFESFLKEANIKYELDIENINGDDVVMICFDDQKLPFWSIISTGTRSLTLFYYWLQRIKDENDVSFVFIDEFDAFYHHKLTKLIVEKLKESHVQFILTTHNTTIMTNDLLRPDCYFMLDNNKIVPTSNLTNKDLRKAHNIEKMYRAGAFDE